MMQQIALAVWAVYVGYHLVRLIGVAIAAVRLMWAEAKRDVEAEGD